jgi:hypothetical protein
MNVDETLLLRQILEELRAQSQCLYDLRKRLDDLERTMGNGLQGLRTALERTPGRE